MKRGKKGCRGWRRGEKGFRRLRERGKGEKRFGNGKCDYEWKGERRRWKKRGIGI